MKRHVAATLMSAVVALGASATQNMWLLPAMCNQMNVGHTAGTETYVLYTTGTDPYVSMSNLERDLTDSENYLTFEYMASSNTGHVELFFHYPATAGISQVYSGLSVTGTWTKVSLDISAARKTFNWGARGDQLRIDFGNVSGNTIQVRNIRINALGEEYTPREDVFSLDAVLALGLPVVEITTVGSEEPTCDYVSPPEGSIGAGIANATKVPGQVRVINPDGSVAYNSGEYVKNSSGMTVKLRGNTSAYPPKKPYKIKLQKKADMLCRGNKNYNDKNWVLIKDESQLMRNGFKMNELTGQQWAPAAKYVNVVFNGQFRGFYLLAESVERNTTGRLNVADEGFITEMDAYWWNEDGAYFTSVNNPIHNYTLKYPDYADLTADQKVKIQGYLTQFENSITDGTYPEYIDVASFAGWLVAHDIMGTLDSAGSNMLLTRYDLNEGTPIRMANLWDFDSTESMTNQWSNVHTNNFTKYFNSPSKQFVREFVLAYERIKDTIYDEIKSYIEEREASDEAIAFERSLNLDNEKWTYGNPAGAYCTRRSINWYTNRKVWMDNAVKMLAIFSGIDEVTGDITGVSLEGRTVVADGLIQVYDTAGRCVVKGSDCVEIDNAGLYLVVTAGGSKKVVVR